MSDHPQSPAEAAPRAMAVALPSHGWEDFPSHYRGEEAHQILTAWTALWHPQLLDFGGNLPTWRHYSSSYAPPPSLLLVPRLSDVPEGPFSDGSGVGFPHYRLPSHANRDTVVTAALDTLGLSPIPFPADLLAAFYAWGYATLQIQFLTRQMRYSCSLDEERYTATARAAAQAAIQGDNAEAMNQLRAGFDQLAQERDHYYPVEVFLLEWILTTPEMVRAGALTPVVSDIPIQNVLASSTALLDYVQARPEDGAKLRGRVTDQNLAIIGGEPSEGRISLWPADHVVEHLRLGAKQYQAAIGQSPVVFARRQFGLSPTLPELLKRLGYRGALHFTLDDGKFPRPYQAKSSWQGLSGATLEVMGRLPADAGLPETFLYLATQLSQSMDGDHAATGLLAYWPGHHSIWLDDLRRATEIFPVLGRFVTFDQYFEHPSHLGHADRHASDAYRSPFLSQDVQAGKPQPVTGELGIWQDWRIQTAASHLQALTTIVRGVGLPPDHDLDPDGALATYARALGGTTTATRSEGNLIANPWCYPKRTLIELPDGASEGGATEGVVARGEQNGKVYAVVDVPSFGYAWIAGHAASPSSSGTNAPVPPVAESHVLQNEFMRITIDPKTGGIGSIRDYQHRDNLLSQQLSVRITPESGPSAAAAEATYTRMVVEGTEVIATGKVWGSLESFGRMVDPHDRSLYQYRQRLTLWRGSRTVWVDIELIPTEHTPQLDHAPWDNYVAFRIAWKDASAVLYRDLHFARQSTDLTRFDAPGYVEVQSGKRRFAVLSAGLPYHRRVDERMLDTVLVTGRESTRKFRLGIAVDATYPWLEVVAAPESGPFGPPVTRWSTPCPAPASHPRSWLLHLDAKNVWMSGVVPLLKGDKCIGFRARLLETEGRTATAHLSCFRELKEGRILTLAGQCESTARIENGALTTTLGSYEWLEVEAYWS